MNLLTITVSEILIYLFAILAIFIATIAKLGHMIISSYYEPDDDIEIDQNEETELIDSFPYEDEVYR